MKKPKLLFGILIGFLILSCSSDDDSNDTNQDDLVGTWNLVSIENQGNDVMVIDCQTEQNIVYNSNNSGTEKAPEEISQTPCEFNNVPFSWIRNGNQVTITVDQEGTFVNEILLLTENNLEIVVTEMNGTPVPQNEQEIFKYEK
ncbi:lipocalin-like domain-containing protein [Winogradskyella alexanderae]|uniref:Lipocalin family protein n=1 Tax=Winogradskyella alexanderae TaxID=2877123 RepID=A0ABS7XY26_9FLAO|nr:lipocalin family protein [Winogradskyella alexanderae]MCA0133762.1 lipocalin family protein [Winogradskyella alexanderae]